MTKCLLPRATAVVLLAVASVAGAQPPSTTGQLLDDLHPDHPSEAFL